MKIKNLLTANLLISEEEKTSASVWDIRIASAVGIAAGFFGGYYYGVHRTKKQIGAGLETGLFAPSDA